MYIFQFVHVQGVFWKDGVEELHEHALECIETRDNSGNSRVRSFDLHNLHHFHCERTSSQNLPRS